MNFSKQSSTSSDATGGNVTTATSGTSSSDMVVGKDGNGRKSNHKKSADGGTTRDRAGPDRGLLQGQETVLERVRKSKGAGAQTGKPGQESNKQGTLLGVVFPCMANILGVLLFLRLPFIVGKAGVSGSLGLVFVCCLTTFITALSLAAVSTNGKIRGGGSYYIISRSLGPAIGAGVGFCFYLANSIGAAMYLMGTVEAWEVARPDSQIVEPGDLNNIRFTALALLGGCAAIVRVGIKYVAKISTLLLGVVMLVILCMYIGCFIGPTSAIEEPAFKNDALVGNLAHLKTKAGFKENFSSPSEEYLKENAGSKYHREQFAYPKDKTEWGFVSLMALWFPACTGIMAGSNRSADLRDPSTSIPRGTLFAQGVTSIIYLSFCVIYGCVASRELLLNDPFLASTTAWPHKSIVIYGVMASTIGAALQSLVSATRLLQAIAADGTLPFLAPFKYDRTGGRSLLASSILTVGAISIGQLNAVAPLLTMFFLICYFCVNSCCFLLSLLGDANWRPSFQYYHWSVAFMGMCLCAVLMFLIDIGEALIAMGFAACIVILASHYSAEINWGDGFKGFRYQIARMILSKSNSEAHAKNWRPQILVLTGLTPDDTSDTGGLVIHDIGPIHLASQLKHGRGLNIIGGMVYEKDFLGAQDTLLSSSTSRAGAIRNWGIEVHRSLRAMGIDAFAKILYTSRRTEGIMSLIQTAGLGPLEHNSVMVSWPFSWVVNPDIRRRFIQTMQVCSIFDKTAIICKEGYNFPLNHEPQKGFIDVWWLMADGGPLLLLPILLRKHTVWKRCHIRLYAVVDKTDDLGEVRNELKQYLVEHRIPNVEVHTVGVEGSDVRVLSNTDNLAKKLEHQQRYLSSKKASIMDYHISKLRTLPKNAEEQEEASTPRATMQVMRSQSFDAGSSKRHTPPSPPMIPHATSAFVRSITARVTGSKLFDKSPLTPEEQLYGEQLVDGKEGDRAPSDDVGAKMNSKSGEALSKTESKGSFQRGIERNFSKDGWQDPLSRNDDSKDRSNSKDKGDTKDPFSSNAASKDTPSDNKNFLSNITTSLTGSFVAGRSASKDSRSSFPSYRRSTSNLASTWETPKYDSKPINYEEEIVPSSFILSNERLISGEACPEDILHAAKSLNKYMQQISSKSALVVTNLPDVPGDITAVAYMQFVEHLCSGLKRVLLVKGSHMEVITAFT